MPPVGARNEQPPSCWPIPRCGCRSPGAAGRWWSRSNIASTQESARAFHNVMQEVQLSRQRNGAYGWSIARDIADPELWTERYHCPTWLDYLRQRNRPTQSERALHQRAMDFHLGPEPVRVRRMLERPFGSVRWKEDTPDRAASEVLPVATAAGSMPDLAGLSAPAQPRRPNPSARCTSARSIFISGPNRSASAACWSGRSARCAGRKIPPTALQTRSCRWSQRPRAAAPDRTNASRMRGPPLTNQAVRQAPPRPWVAAHGRAAA